MSDPRRTTPRELLLVGFGVLAVSMVAFFRVPLLPSIGRELSMSAADLGVVTTVFAVGRLATDIPAGRLADRWSAAVLLAVAAGILAAASLVLAAAGTSALVFLAAFVLGVASAMANTTGVTFFSESASTARRGRALAWFSAALLGGQAFGPAVGGSLASLGTWRTAQVWAAVIAAAVVAVMVGGSRSLSAAPRAVSAVQTKPEASSADTGGEQVHVPLGEKLILYAVPFVMFFTLGAMPQTLVPIIGATGLGLTAATIGLALGLGGGCRLLGAVVGGVVSDRVSRKAALVPGLAVQGAGVALLAVEGAVWIWVTAIVIMSLASFGISVAATMLADHYQGRSVGRHLGPFRFVGDIGLVVGPVAVALVFEHVGQQAAVLAVAGLLVACSIASLLWLTETRWLALRGDGVRAFEGRG